MTEKKISDFTEKDFVSWVAKIIRADFSSEKENDDAIFQFARLTEHPAGWNLIFRPEAGSDASAEGIVNTVKQWRAAHGKPGFKAE